MVRTKLLVLVLVLLVAGYIFVAHTSFKEVRYLNTTEWDTDTYAAYFSNLAREEGSEYAFEVLRRVDFPAGINLHTVAHPVGAVLYAEEGISGIQKCTDEFRSACAHAIVIQAFIEQGATAFSDIMTACEQAPGGKAAYAMCVHGVGHGVLAHEEYDVPRAIETCNALDSGESGVLHHRFTNAWQECVGGVVMELIQGVHDEAAWEKASPLYLPPDDIHMPCTASFMPPYARPACYLSLTQRFFIETRAPRENPPPETYAPAMVWCEDVFDAASRAACFGGFGKEFVFYATQRDGGDVNALSDEAVRSIHTWCSWAAEDDGIRACSHMALDTLFWGGQNNPESALSFCRVAPEASRPACYAGLIENGVSFLEEPDYAALCRRMPEAWRADCTSFAPQS